MSVNENALPAKDALLPPDQAFEWPRQAMLERSWMEAAGRWAVLRRVYPEHPSAWIQGAIAHLELGELDKADALLAHARRQFPDNPNSFTHSAEIAMRRQEWELAETLLGQARERFPGDLQTWMKSAEYAERQGAMEEATAYNEKARLCAPDRPASFIQYAEMAMRAENWNQALSRWKKVREKFPNVPAGYVRAAEAARKLDCLRDAQRLILAQHYGGNILHETQQLQDAKRQRGIHKTPLQLAELIWTKAILNLRSEVQRNYLSYVWWVLEPLLHMLLYYVVFGLLLNRGGDNYPVFLLSGLVPWLWFMKAVSNSSGSILVNQNLMLQVGLPIIIFPLINLLQTSIKQLPVFLLLIGFVWLQGYSPAANWWSLIPLIVVQALLIVAFSCAVAAVIPFVRDLGILVPTGLMFLMFTSGVFYDFRMISPELQGLFLLNPAAFLLKCYREIIIDGVLPDFATLAWWGLACAITFMLLAQVYKRLRYVYPRIVIQ